MPGYAIGILPLMSLIGLNDDCTGVKQAAFADDLTGVGKLKPLKIWWNMILEYGPYIGYHAKPSKSWLIVKKEYLEEAKILFKNTGLNITSEGRKHLGAAVGSETFKESYVKDKIENWIIQIKELAKIAWVEPHLAYSAFVKGFRHKFNYLMRTIPEIDALFKPLDLVIDDFLLPALLNGKLLNKEERILFALPVKFGGMGLPKISETASTEYNNSRLITEDLVENVKKQKDILEILPDRTYNAKKLIRAEKTEQNKNTLIILKTSMSSSKLRLLECILEKGSSNWLTALPIKESGFYLDKSTWWDALYLRYGFNMKRLPSYCNCGKAFSVEHAMLCMKGGYVTMRHNELRDMTAELLEEVCKENLSWQN